MPSLLHAISDFNIFTQLCPTPTITYVSSLKTSWFLLPNSILSETTPEDQGLELADLTTSAIRLIKAHELRHTKALSSLTLHFSRRYIISILRTFELIVHQSLRMAQPAMESTKPTKTILDLPAEVLRNVFKSLKYPDITRVKQTCHQLKAFVTDDGVRDSILRLEDDWAAARMTENSRSNPARHDRLQEMGYETSDINKLDPNLPCYACMKIREPSKFLRSASLSLVSSYAAQLAMVSRRLLEATMSRHCLDCYLESEDYLDKQSHGSRWLCRQKAPSESLRDHNGNTYYYQDDSKRQWLLVCRGCDEYKEAKVSPKLLQQKADLCSDCWEQIHPEWFAFKTGLQSRRLDIESGIHAIYDQMSELDGYTHWMSTIEAGRERSLDHAPSLADVVNPDWSEIMDHQMNRHEN